MTLPTARCALAGGVAGRPEGPLLMQKNLREDGRSLPLDQMTVEERLVADYAGTGLTVGSIPCTTGARNSARREFIFRRLAPLPQRRVCARGRLRHRAPAPRDREGFHFYLHGR